MRKSKIQIKEISIAQGTESLHKEYDLALDARDFSKCDGIYLEVIKDGGVNDYQFGISDTTGVILDMTGSKFLQASEAVAPDQKFLTATPFELREGQGLRVKVQINNPLQSELTLLFHFRLIR